MDRLKAMSAKSAGAGRSAADEASCNEEAAAAAGVSDSSSSFISISGRMGGSGEASTKGSSSSSSSSSDGGGGIPAAAAMDKGDDAGGRFPAAAPAKGGDAGGRLPAAPAKGGDAGGRLPAAPAKGGDAGGRLPAAAPAKGGDGGGQLPTPAAPPVAKGKEGRRKRHNAGEDDETWAAIEAVKAKEGKVGMEHLRLVKKIGSGDVGDVYLAQLIIRRKCCNTTHDDQSSAEDNYKTTTTSTSPFFAVKIISMDASSAAAGTSPAASAAAGRRRKQQLQRRAATERDILLCLDHPFLPSLYAHFHTRSSLCLLIDFCPGGDLHSLRQRQPSKRFSEAAARFYAAEVLVALEYLHIMGVIYRDLKPENVLVRQNGHIMLSDFDLSLRCTAAVQPKLVKSASSHTYPDPRPLPAAAKTSKNPFPASYCVGAPAADSAPSACLLPKLLASLRITNSRRRIRSGKKIAKCGGFNKDTAAAAAAADSLPEIVAEPTETRSMSFVGTHEYLAPEIIRGEGHGSAVDWWTYGVFLYELMYGRTPFKGSSNRATLFNIIGQPLRFPEDDNGGISDTARDLIACLLVKEPEHRLAYERGALEIKQHPFFSGVNWALIRSMAPPFVPNPIDVTIAGNTNPAASAACVGSSPAPPACIAVGDDAASKEPFLEFEFF